MRLYFYLFVILSLNHLYSYQKPLPSYSHRDSKGIPLDHKLAKLLSKRDGIFIEVGAFDGVTQSNTKLLEDEFNWHGILIEPNPFLLKAIIKNRPKATVFQCALGSLKEDNTLVWGDFKKPKTMSSIGGKRLNRFADTQVRMRSLQSILDEVHIQHIDFFSLDTEGYELSILLGIDFKRTTFDYILVEIYQSQYNQIVKLLSQKGYKLFCNFSNYNKKNNPNWDGQHNDFLFKRDGLD